MRNNEITKSIQGRRFYLFGRHNRSLLPNKPGILLVECRATGRMVLFATSDIQNRAQKVMDYAAQNPFYKERGMVEQHRYMFWFHLAGVSTCVHGVSRKMAQELGTRVFVKNQPDVKLPGWRGYMIVHRPSGYYILVKRENKALDFLAWYRKLSWTLRNAKDDTESIMVLALTTHSGVHGIKREDFIVKPLFAAASDEREAKQLLLNEILLAGTAKLMTKGLVAEEQWDLFKRFNPLYR